MHQLIRLLGLATLCAVMAFAETPVQTQSGDLIASEDTVVRNFHLVDLGLSGLLVVYLRISEDHWPVDRAITEMRAFGHNWPKYSSNGATSSWHEDFLKSCFWILTGMAQ